jgi:hypothetical protein
MKTITVSAGLSVDIKATRARDEVSGFQLFYNDHTTGGWSGLGPRMYVGESFWSPLLTGDPRLNAKNYDWGIGVDLVSIDGGSAASVTAEVIDPATTDAFHINDFSGNENTTIILTFHRHLAAAPPVATHVGGPVPPPFNEPRPDVPHA